MRSVLCHTQGRKADDAVLHARMAQLGPTQQSRRQRQPGPLPSRILWLRWQQPLQVQQGFYCTTCHIWQNIACIEYVQCHGSVQLTFAVHGVPECHSRGLTVRHVARDIGSALRVSHLLAVQGSQQAPCSPPTAVQIRPAHTTSACQQPCEFHTLRLILTRPSSVLPHSLAFGRGAALLSQCDLYGER